VVKTFKRFGFTVVCELFDEEVTKDAIERELSRLVSKYAMRNGKKIGRLYIMFAGHGVPDPDTPDGSSLFCCHDYDPERPYETAYPLTEIKNKLKRIAIKHQVVHLDSCHAGGIFLDTRARDAPFVAARMAQQPSVSAITAVTADEEAIETNGHGLFTKTLCETLDNGHIFDTLDKHFATMSEVFDMVRARVTNEAHERGGRSMTPMKRDVLGQHGGEQCTGEMLFFDARERDGARGTAGDEAS